MSFIRVNIAIKPSSEVTKQALQLSEEINKKADAYFILDGRNFFPHLTLYSPEYPERNLNEVLATISDIAKQSPSFTTSKSSLSSHLGYIDVAFDKSQEWVQLHELVMNALNPLRENHLREKYKHPEELAKYSKDQQEYIQKYGYAEVLTTFRPHLTLSRLKDEAIAKEIAAGLHFPIESFRIDTIAAYTMGDYGTCIKLIKEFSMK